MSYTYTTLKTAIQDYTQNTETSFVKHLENFIKNAEERILKNIQLSYFRKNQSGTTSNTNKYLAVPSDFLAPYSLSITSSSEHIFLEFKDVDFVQTFNPNAGTTGTPRFYAVFDVNNFILGPTPDGAYTAELHYYYRPDSLTQSKFTLTVSGVSGTFQASETITGGTSGAVTTISSVTSSTVFNIIIPSTDFTVGETVTGATSGATGTVVSTSADTTKTWLSENAPLAILYGSLVEAYTYMKGDPTLMQEYEKRLGESIIAMKLFGESKEPTDEYRAGKVIRPKQ